MFSDKFNGYMYYKKGAEFTGGIIVYQLHNYSLASISENS